MHSDERWNRDVFFPALRSAWSRGYGVALATPGGGEDRARETFNFHPGGVMPWDYVRLPAPGSSLARLVYKKGAAPPADAHAPMLPVFGWRSLSVSPGLITPGKDREASASHSATTQPGGGAKSTSFPLWGVVAAGAIVLLLLAKGTSDGL